MLKERMLLSPDIGLQFHSPKLTFASEWSLPLGWSLQLGDIMAWQLWHGSVSYLVGGI